MPDGRQVSSASSKQASRLFGKIDFYNDLEYNTDCHRLYFTADYQCLSVISVVPKSFVNGCLNSNMFYIRM